MRILNFIINGQQISRSPTCDFTGIVPGTEGYLKAQFSFSADWNLCPKKVAVFERFGVECPVAIIRNICEIPAEILTSKSFKLSVVGAGDSIKLTTNKCVVEQEGK